MVKHLAAQITVKSAPKIAKCAFPKRETYNSSNLLLYKKDKKDNDHAKKYKVRFLNSQSMVFKIETYNSSKLLLYKRGKKDKCQMWKVCVFRKSVERTRCLFFKIRYEEILRIYSPPSPKTHIVNFTKHIVCTHLSFFQD